MSAAWQDAIDALLDQGGDDNHAVFGGDDGFLIVRAAQGGATLTVEAAADRHLPDGVKLSPPALQRLHAAGFPRRTAARVFLRQQDRPDAAALAAELADLMRAVYDSKDETVALHLGHAEPQTNPDLIRAMRALSQKRDMRARQTVYRMLVDAPLLIAVETVPESPHAAQGADLQLRTLGTLGEHVSVGAFTDIETLRRGYPRGLPYVILPGRVSIPLMMARRVGSLLINPGGDVGGELYRNELQAIHEFIQRTSARH